MATEQEGAPYPEGDGKLVAAFRAEADGAERMVFFTEEGRAKVPIEEIERAIAVAKREVHSEDYYDRRDSAA